ncbi:heavy metal-associated isoprenylated plant protein 28 [Olea europaea var. sylvestris]|uniref:heavy metal-associated isoprenylated plant protein 28 n=1 Tax=Olea europaea var. sylvestris TaxID=158386 RepID=UPI000C1D0A9A|nr:heavy metal-associated isoprenylated plant protein 28 [Olea europaea var. sylvestris]
MTIIEMRVHMDCAGCENKIKKALQKVKGVDDIDIDMGMQKVTVTGYADQKKVLRTVRKTGRRAEVWQFPYIPELRNSNYAGNYNYQQHYGGPSTYYASQPSSSCYNYYKHGYNNHNYVPSYGGGSQGHSTVFGNRTGDTFSDENPHGCSIM